MRSFKSLLSKAKRRRLQIDVDSPLEISPCIGQLPESRGALPPRSGGSTATPLGLGAHGFPSTSFGPNSRRGQESDALRMPLASGDAGPSSSSASGAPSSILARTFSRSIREAQTCTSEVGAASIAAILECVEQAQDCSLNIL
eukprot:g16252.t1